MDLLVKADRINLEYLDKTILDISELALYRYDRIGLVGKNGAGKTSLLHILAGLTEGAAERIQIFGEIAVIEQMETADGSEADHRLAGRFGLNGQDREHLSGGEETKLKIAQAFSRQVHAIFADEPTCHLDQKGIRILAEQLENFPGALLLISHDRYFLDRLTDKIWELDGGKITEYWGNYSDYLEQKEEERKSLQEKYDRTVTEKERLTRAAGEKKKKASGIDQAAGSVSRADARARGNRKHETKSHGTSQKGLYRAAKAIESRIGAMEEAEAPAGERQVRFRKSRALELFHPYPIMGDRVNLQFDGRILFDNASFQFPLGKKIALCGDNGSGKTTLFRMIRNGAPGIFVSPKAQIGYFAQNSFQVRKEPGVMEYMTENCDYGESEIRSVLANMGFEFNDCKKCLGMLSGGELMKLQLAKVLLGRYNILMLDEPANFLDLKAVEALEKLIQGYEGTVIFISHDKRLIDGAADMTYEIAGGKIGLKDSAEGKERLTNVKGI